MQELTERVYFRVCLSAGRLLRSSKYSRTRIVYDGGGPRVEKSRLPHAPLFIWLGGPLLRILDAGIRILRQRDWEARERLIHQRLRGRKIRIEGDGTLVLPMLPGETLSNLLENSQTTDAVRRTAVELAVVALAGFHQMGFTHGDAMAENVIIDLEAGAAHWFDFETMHDPSRTSAWRRADDVRALLVTSLVRTAPEKFSETIDLVLRAYRDPEVTRLLATSFDSVLRRPLSFHLAQAGLSYRKYREISRLLNERRDWRLNV